MTTIAFIGLGAMGSRMAARLLAADHELTVWNRTPDRTAELVQQGARAADSPKDAARDAEIVMAMIRDDAASESIWCAPETGAFAGMAAGTLGIECSTLSPGHVRALHARAAERNLTFLDAPVAGSRAQAEAGKLIFMAGGAAVDVARAEPVLSSIGAAVHHAGGPGHGAFVKLMLNTLFASQLATLAELLGLARSADIDPARALGIIGATPVASPAMKAAGDAMLASDFSPAFPVDLVRKDMSLTIETARRLGRETPLTTATAMAFDRTAAEGLAECNITAIARLYADDPGTA